MPKRAGGDGPKNLNIPTTPKLRAYLRDLVEEEGYGEDATNVAKNLIWRAIEALIKDDVIPRKKGKYPQE